MIRKDNYSKDGKDVFFNPIKDTLKIGDAVKIRPEVYSNANYNGQNSLKTLLSPPFFCLNNYNINEPKVYSLFTELSFSTESTFNSFKGPMTHLYNIISRNRQTYDNIKNLYSLEERLNINNDYGYLSIEYNTYKNEKVMSYIAKNQKEVDKDKIIERYRKTTIDELLPIPADSVMYIMAIYKSLNIEFNKGSYNGENDKNREITKRKYLKQVTPDIIMQTTWRKLLVLVNIYDTLLFIPAIYLRHLFKHEKCLNT